MPPEEGGYPATGGKKDRVEMGMRLFCGLIVSGCIFVQPEIDESGRRTYRRQETQEGKYEGDDFYYEIVDSSSGWIAQDDFVSAHDRAREVFGAAQVGPMLRTQPDSVVHSFLISLGGDEVTVKDFCKFLRGLVMVQFALVEFPHEGRPRIAAHSA